MNLNDGNSEFRELAKNLIHFWHDHLAEAAPGLLFDGAIIGTGSATGYYFGSACGGALGGGTGVGLVYLYRKFLGAPYKSIVQIISEKTPEQKDQMLIDLLVLMKQSEDMVRPFLEMLERLLLLNMPTPRF